MATDNLNSYRGRPLSPLPQDVGVDEAEVNQMVQQPFVPLLGPGPDSEKKKRNKIGYKKK